jgi:hypothetical protein
LPISHVFISYSHEDAVYAHNLARTLEGLGFKVWIDDRIDYGSVWPQVIEEKISTCDAFILIMTPHSYSSVWVQNELACAQGKKKPIFPLLLGGDKPWLSVQAIQYVDVREGGLPPGRFYSDLAKAILDEMTRRGERIAEIVRSPRIRDGSQLVRLCNGAHAHIINHDDLPNEQTMTLFRDFLQAIEDSEVICELGRSAQVELACSLSRQIWDLETEGFYVYAARAKRTLQFGRVTLPDAEVLIVVVTRQLVDSLDVVLA